MSHHRGIGWLGAVASGVVLLLAGVQARADTALYQRTLRSTGWVVVPRPGGLASGTCWLADGKRRLAITCRHVVGDSTEVLVYFPRFEKKNKRPVVEAARYLREFASLQGVVVATDAARDLALLRLASLPEGVEALPLADEGCGPGDDIHSIGNCGLAGDLAEGTLWWYTRGSVRQVHRRRVKAKEGLRRVWLLETQAPVNEGDSGGPVVDGKGRLVGVTDSYTSGQRLVTQNIDVREVRAFLAQAEKKFDKAEAVVRLTPLGKWTFRGGDDETPGGEGEFRSDGTFVLSRPGKPLKGRFAYANGLLWLIAENALAQASPAWHGKDRFSVKVGEEEWTFNRAVEKTALQTAREE